MRVERSTLRRTGLLAILLVLLLAACGGEEATPTPVLEEPTVDLDPTAVVEPTDVVEPTEVMEEPTQVVEPTEEMEEPTATEEPEATATAEGQGAEGDGPQVALELVAEGFTAPLVYQPAPDGRTFVVDQPGLIYVLDEQGQRLETPFLDLRDRMVQLDEGYDERGLLGLALHPDFAENGRFFVYYSAPLREGAPQDWDHTSHISEFQVSQDADAADPGSERILLQVDQPQGNHDGGQIAFGPDGYLYIPLGDGGGANDTGTGHVEDWYEFNAGGNGQAVDQNLLGSILRIDVDNEGANGEAYAIPDDNPFADGAEALPETWAYGFRNPFRISFDSGGDNELFVGDAGQDRWEEVSIVSSGGNYGWNVKEATHCFDAANPGAELQECPDETPDGEPLIDPIIEYRNGNQPEGIGLVVIGGNVYRGSALAEMEGRYFFGDWSTSFGEGDGTLFVATRPDGEGQLWDFEEISIVNRDGGQLGEFLLSFGEDADGELVILTSETPGVTGETGKIYRLTPAQ